MASKDDKRDNIGATIKVMIEGYCLLLVAVVSPTRYRLCKS